jgi:Txe/YoeB family toxin of Txe-Axe toxin-antitoxin module
MPNQQEVQRDPFKAHVQWEPGYDGPDPFRDEYEARMAKRKRELIKCLTGLIRLCDANESQIKWAFRELVSDKCKGQAHFEKLTTEMAQIGSDRIARVLNAL